MNRSNISESKWQPIVVRAGDLQALADRLEAWATTPGAQGDMAKDVITAARLARHAAITWVRGISVSLR
jgi:hypothetical protein